MSEVPLDPIAIDVGGLVQRTVASLYSHLVTRQTGRAVRLAIETQLAEAGSTSLSLIDLSEVSILDFSCADEVVAKLLLRYQEGAQEAFFVFLGVHEPHRDQVEVVLKRQSLAVVAETQPDSFELLGDVSAEQATVWRLVEERGRVGHAELGELLDSDAQRAALEALVRRRLVFRNAATGRYHALSRLIRHRD